MSEEKYKIGTMLLIKDSKRKGVVVSCEEVPPYKIVCKDDICVKWDYTKDTGEFTSTYDKWFLDEKCYILEEIRPAKR